MAGGLRDEIDLDVTGALAQVGRIEAALDAAAKSFRVELSHSLDVLRSADTHVDVTADARQVTGAITGAVDAADTAVTVTGEARDVTGAITGAVDAADTTVDVDVDPKAFRQLKADIERVNAELNDTRAQLNKVEGELDQVRRKGGDVEKSFGHIRTAAAGALSALGTRFVIDQIQEMIGAASDLAESQSKVDVVFGESQGVIDEWAESSAQSVGLAKQQALEAAGTFGNLFTALGLTRGAAAELSPDVVQLGADLASFNNLGVPETLEKLRSGLVGEIEPLRSLGISFGAVEVEAEAMKLGLAGANGEISEGAKVQARWSLITQQSSAAAGDFARTADGLANQSRIMAAELGNARAEIGTRLLPVMLEVVQKGRGMLDFFLSLPTPVQNGALALGALFIALGPIIAVSGNVAKAVSTAASAITALATTTAASTLILSSLAVAAIGVGVAYYAYTQITKAMREAQASFDEQLAESTNNLALATIEAERGSQTLRDNAVAAYIAGAAYRGFSSDADEVAQAGAEVSVKTKEAIRVLNDLQGVTGVSRERIVQLANSLRINLGTATDEQREKLAAAIAEISRGVYPTERLAAVEEVLGNQFATTSEQVDAFKEALDAALGVYLSSEEATIRVRQRLDELAAALKAGREEGESVQQFQDRLTLSTISLARSVEDEVAALTRAGQVSADAGAQKEALTSRLLALADTIGGPLSDKLREYAMRVGSIPQAPTTTPKVDTAPALRSLADVPLKAREYAAMTAAYFAAGIVQGFRDENGRITASADSIATTIKNTVNRRLGIQSPSRVGMEIGGFFVEGIALGVEAAERTATQAAEALAAGVGDVMLAAAAITRDESQAILEAVAASADAETALSEARKEHGRASIEARIAELDLAAAQEEVNERTLDAIDATDAITEALERQRQARDDLNNSLDGTLSALDALQGVGGARRALSRAEAELTAARQRSRALPREIAEAEANLAREREKAQATTNAEALAIVRAKQTVLKAEKSLADARADATTPALDLREAELELEVAEQRLTEAKNQAVEPTREVTAAEKVLEELRKEQAASAERVRAATQAVTDAQLQLVDAQRQLIDAGAQLTGTQAEVEAYFRAIAEAAGLSRREIDALVESMLEARRTADNADRATGGSGSGTAPGGRLVNTVTGRPAFTGPNGEGGSAGPRGVAGETSWTMPDGTRVWYVPRQNIDQGNLGALGRAPVAANLPATKPAPAGSKPAARTTTQNITINPKKAVYDPKATVATLRTLELLKR